MFKKIINFFNRIFNNKNIKENEKYEFKIIPVFVPHLGCPEDCVFCNQTKIAGAMPNITIEDAKNIIEKHLSTIKKHENLFIEIAFFGGSFTAINKEFIIPLLDLAEGYINEGKVDGIRFSTRPDAISKEILDNLKKYTVTTIELGIQSSNDYILKKARRGHDFKSVINASKLIKKRGIKFGAQMMIGLPESTYLDEINTAKDIIKLKPDMVRIYPTLVLENTDLENDLKNEEYIPLTLDEAVEVTKEVAKLFKDANIDIIRIGLQSTEEISNSKSKKSSVIAGPYHENFRELVESKIWYDKILEKILKINTKVDKVTIRIHPKNVNKVVGYKRENILRFKEDYNLNINLEYSTKIPLDDFILESGD